MRELFSIGEISRLFQLPVSTIRYYCDIGLVTPAKVDERSGYRYFSTEQFELLNTLKYLQALGMPLSDIRELLRNRSTENFVSRMEKQKEETERQIFELMEIREKLTARIAQINDASRAEQMDQIRLLQLPARTAVMLHSAIEPDADLELKIRILENRSEMESAVFLGKVGLSIAQEHLSKGDFSQYRAIFLLVENERYNRQMGEPLASGQYAVLRFHGTHRDAAPHYRRLMDFIEENHCAVAGHSVEITLVDFGMTQDPEKFITEIQIPVDSQVT